MENKHRKFLIVIGGPTASGKTSVAIKLANYYKTEIVSVDSRQFYREMNIGTAKPTEEELAAAPHHFINNLSVRYEYTVGDYERDAIRLLDTLFETKDIVILAGGSGLFIKAVCEGLDSFPDVSDKIKEDLEADYRQFGIGFLQNELRESDPDYYDEVDIHNPHRLLRALSVCRASGEPFSSFRTKEKVERSFTPIYVMLNWDREDLYERINERVDKMMEQGLLKEVEGLQLHKEKQALQTVGYQELFDHLDGKTTLEEAVELIKQNSRRYAKRQTTWFKRKSQFARFHPMELKAIAEFVKAKMSQNWV